MGLTQGNQRNPCCRVEDNLGPWESYQGRKDLGFRRCKLCQCRHFEAEADAGKIFSAGASAGGGKA